MMEGNVLFVSLSKKLNVIEANPYVGQQTNSRIITIFTTWNAMVGLGLVTIPYAFAQAGLLLGLSKCI